MFVSNFSDGGKEDPILGGKPVRDAILRAINSVGNEKTLVKLDGGKQETNCRNQSSVGETN